MGLYERFARDAEPWYRWLLGQLEPRSGERVLDVGAGSGGVWREDGGRHAASVMLSCVDRSPAMLAEARARGVPCRRIAAADALALPFADASYDALLAAHMLYHVPARDRALTEMRRVLRPGGRLYVATNEWTHLIELRELAGRFGLGGSTFRVGRTEEAFDLESAVDEIFAVFGPVRVASRRSRLEITEVAPAVDYVRSVLPERGARDEEALAAFASELGRRIERAGAFETVACAGVVRAIA